MFRGKEEGLGHLVQAQYTVVRVRKHATPDAIPEERFVEAVRLSRQKAANIKALLFGQRALVGLAEECLVPSTRIWNTASYRCIPRKLFTAVWV